MNSAYDEKVLLLHVADGDSHAFRQLYDQYHQKVFSFAFYLTRSSFDAEEITQEIFIRIWKYRSQLPGIENFEAWLKTIVRNRAFTWLQKVSQQKNAAKKLYGQKVSASYNLVLDREMENAMDRAVSQLPNQQKLVFLLSRQTGMKQKDIAQVLGVTLSTVKNHMKAALQSIRIFLHNHTDTIIITGIFLQLFFWFN
ncbi:MAG: RNA polymerase sigma-70 factor [Chitinophagaceae bacterium]|nr:RNA polymerase sigma-70 factor [Chitinophagaceae bacterium]